MRHRLAEKIAAIAPSATEETDNEVKRLLREGAKDLISLGVGEPCFDTPLNIKRAAADALMGGKTKYEPTAGDYTLREAICAKLRTENGITATVRDVMVTPGAKYAIYLAFQALLQEGDRVVLLDPAWVSYEPAAQMAGAEVVHMCSRAEDGFQPDFGKLREVFRQPVKVVVVNSPCNPTGAVFAPETIRAIAKLARDHGAYVLSDEIYETLAYDSPSYSPASEFDNVITVNGFSKSYAMTGWRLGYVAAPHEILEGMLKITQHSTSCVTAFAQSGAIEALTSEESRRAAREMVDGYARRRSLMMDLIGKSEFLECDPEPRGAFYCFPSYNVDDTSLHIAHAILSETHVATVPGAAFGACGEGHLRLSYATTEDGIREAFARMETFFQRRAG
jgi:aspartate aminotransferase